MAVTIKDVARVAGVSHTTVSRALRDNPVISAETAAYIQKLADEMGYVPNASARGLKTKRSNVLGVIVRRIDDPFFSQVLKGIEDILQKEGYSLFLASSHKDSEREREIVKMMSERRVDGVIICSTQVNDEHRKTLERFGVPTVLINNQASTESNFSVYHNDFDGSVTMTKHLLDLGHQKIAYIGNGHAGITNSERVRGYQHALAEYGVEFDPTYLANEADGSPESGAEGVRNLLKLPNPPTAIVCFNDIMVVGAMHALHAAGLQVPADMSLTGFDDVVLSAYVTPAITTFRQPKYELGKVSAEMMLNLLNSPEDKSSKRLRLRGELIVRHSTAKPKIT